MAETAAEARRRRELKAIKQFREDEKKRKAAAAANKKKKATTKPKPKAKPKAKVPAPKAKSKSAYQLLKGRSKQIDDAVRKAKKG